MQIFIKLQFFSNIPLVVCLLKYKKFAEDSILFDQTYNLLNIINKFLQIFTIFSSTTAGRGKLNNTKSGHTSHFFDFLLFYK